MKPYSTTLIAVILLAVISLISTGANGCFGNSSSDKDTKAGSSPGAAPTASAISPASGYNDLNTTVMITGTNFANGATVKVGGVYASNVTVISSTCITATINYGLTGGTVYNVLITNSDSQSATLANAFTAMAPPTEWTKDADLIWNCAAVSEALTSSCTILITDTNKYRIYFTAPGGLWSSLSDDGANWETPVFTNINDVGATNPAVIRLKNGTYLMIYGIQTAMPTTERLYRAISNDGITFAKQGVALVADAGEDDFVSVPDLIYITDTRLRMYFVADPVDSNVHTAYSDNNGINWTREGAISITGGPTGGQTNDPDIIELADGTYQFFFTTPPAGQAIGDLRIRSAVSTDGRNFTLESGSRVTPAGAVTAIMDPDCILIKGTVDQYRIYYGANKGVNPDDLRSITLP
ncbi:MAG: IPT/TIG domain-containing protein [Planctomycetes bacterium]|nr:IPT/TIG domain-containing protein [Planctomycetota bacterium]